MSIDSTELLRAEFVKPVCLSIFKQNLQPCQQQPAGPGSKTFCGSEMVRVDAMPQEAQRHVLRRAAAAPQVPELDDDDIVDEWEVTPAAAPAVPPVAAVPAAPAAVPAAAVAVPAVPAAAAPVPAAATVPAVAAAAAVPAAAAVLAAAAVAVPAAATVPAAAVPATMTPLAAVPRATEAVVAPAAAPAAAPVEEAQPFIPPPPPRLLGIPSGILIIMGLNFDWCVRGLERGCHGLPFARADPKKDIRWLAFGFDSGFVPESNVLLKLFSYVANTPECKTH